MHSLRFLPILSLLLLLHPIFTPTQAVPAPPPPEELASGGQDGTSHSGTGQGGELSHTHHQGDAGQGVEFCPHSLHQGGTGRGRVQRPSSEELLAYRKKVVKNKGESPKWVLPADEDLKTFIPLLDASFASKSPEEQFHDLIKVPAALVYPIASGQSEDGETQYRDFWLGCGTEKGDTEVLENELKWLQNAAVPAASIAILPVYSHVQHHPSTHRFLMSKFPWLQKYVKFGPEAQEEMEKHLEELGHFNSLGAAVGKKSWETAQKVEE